MNIKGLVLVAAVAAAPLMGATAALAQAADGPADLLKLGAPAAAPAIVASPTAVTSTDAGDVSFVVTGSGFPSNMTLNMASNGLNGACDASPFAKPKQVKVDRRGNFNTSVSASGCLAGTYTIEATETATPRQTFTTTVTIADPR